MTNFLYYLIFISISMYSTPDRKVKPDSDLETFQGTSSLSQFTTFTQSHHQTPDLPLQGQCFNPIRVNRNQRMITTRMKREQKVRRRKLLYEALGKIMMTKFYNKKYAFNCFKNIPEPCRVLKRKNTTIESDVAQKLIFKTQITVETAIVRSILNLRKLKRVSMENENPEQKLNGKNNNIGISALSYYLTVYPSESKSEKIYKKLAIFQLNEMVSKKLKLIVMCFDRNARYKKTLNQYFVTMIGSMNQNARNFLIKLRLITLIYKSDISYAKRKAVEKLLKKCMERRKRFLLTQVKANYQREMIKQQVSLELLNKSVLLKKMSALFTLYKYSIENSKKEKQEQKRMSSGQIQLIVTSSSDNSEKQELIEQECKKSQKSDAKIFKRTSRPQQNAQ